MLFARLVIAWPVVVAVAIGLVFLCVALALRVSLAVGTLGLSRLPLPRFVVRFAMVRLALESDTGT